MTLRLGMLASHAGSGVEVVLEECRAGRLAATPALVISNNADANALVLARAAGVPARHLSGRTHPDPDALDAAILQTLSAHGVDLVLLLGYLKLLGPRTIAAYRGRLLNTHPGPLPRFGGPGMYGRRVHAAVLAAGERQTAATIHHVDEVYDHGAAVAVAAVPVEPTDTPERLADRVRVHEHRLLRETLARIASGTLVLPALHERGRSRSHVASRRTE